MARNIKDGFFIENAIIQTSVDNLKISLQSLSDSLLVELNSSQKVIVFEFHLVLWWRISSLVSFSISGLLISTNPAVFLSIFYFFSIGLLKERSFKFVLEVGSGRFFSPSTLALIDYIFIFISCPTLSILNDFDIFLFGELLVSFRVLEARIFSLISLSSVTNLSNLLSRMFFLSSFPHFTLASSAMDSTCLLSLLSTPATICGIN